VNYSNIINKGDIFKVVMAEKAAVRPPDSAIKGPGERHYIAKSRQFRCSIDHAKKSFFRSANAIFGKIGRIASEEVTLELLKTKCIPVLIYGLKCFSLPKSDLKSDFAVTRFLMKLFRT